MSGDKRSVATDALEVLGTIITDKKVGRDAVHLACLPAKCADGQLQPGQDVGLTDNGFASMFVKKKIGIVDPFLKEPVHSGEEFLVIVYPRTIESLRHVWSHPDVPDEAGAEGVGKDPKKMSMDEADEELDRVLRDMRSGLDEPVTVGDLRGGMDSGYVTVYGTDAHGLISYPAEAWVLYEIAYGRRAHHDPRNPGTDPVYFSCSC